jgi:hypothetical protein
MAMTTTKARFIGLGIAALVVLVALIVNVARGSGSTNWYSNGQAYPAAYARAAGLAASEALVPGTGQVWCQSQLGQYAGGRDQDDFGVDLKSPSDPYTAEGTEWINGCAAGFLRVQRSPSANAQSSSAPPQISSSPAQASGWSAAQPIDANNGFASVSCPTSSFCVAVDSAGNAYTFSGASWSAGRQVDSSGNGLNAVSCASSSFCAATDSGPDAFIYSNGRWSSTSLVGSGGNRATLTSVSCPAVGFCVATGLNDAYTYSGGKWSAGRPVQINNQLTSISCATSSFCAAVDDGGYVYTYSVGSWSAGQDIDTDGRGLIAVSCPASGFCVAADSGPDAYVYSNGHWSGTSLVGAGGNPATLTSVSCPAAGFCVATGLEDAYTYSGGTWSTGQTVENDLTLKSISCPTRSFCVAADSAGNVYRYSVTP